MRHQFCLQTAKLHVVYFYLRSAKATLFSPTNIGDQRNSMSVPQANTNVIVLICVCVCVIACSYACKCEKKKRGCGCQRKKNRMACENEYIWPSACMRATVWVWEAVWETKIACVGWNEKTPLPLRWFKPTCEEHGWFVCVNPVRVCTQLQFVFEKSSRVATSFLKGSKPVWSQEAHDEK